MSRERNRRAIISAGVGVSQRIVQFIGTLLTMPLVLRALGQEQFGVWSAATSVAWLSGLADFGISFALVMLVGKAIALGHIDQARQQIEAALKLGTFFAILVFTVASIVIINAMPAAQVNPYLVAVAALTLSVPLGIANSVWMALQKGYVSSGWETVQTVISVGGLVIAVTVPLESDALVYVALFLLGTVVANLGSLIHLFIRHPELRPLGLATTSLESLREMAYRSTPFFILGVANVMAVFGDNVLALELLGADASAQMAIALRLCVTAMGLLVVMSQPLMPAFTDAIARTDIKWVRRTLIHGSLLTIGAAIAGASIIVLFGEPLLHWWLGSNLTFPRNLYWAMAAWIIAVSIVRVPALLINAAWIIKFQLLLAAIHGIAAFSLKFVLAPLWGVSGILWGTTLSNILVVAPAYAYLFYRRKDLWQVHRQALIINPPKTER